MSHSFADEPEGDGHRFVRQARTNMRAPAVKATGKIISSFCVQLLVLSHLKRKPHIINFVIFCRGVVPPRSL